MGDIAHSIARRPESDFIPCLTELRLRECDAQPEQLQQIINTPPFSRTIKRLALTLIPLDHVLFEWEVAPLDFSSTSIRSLHLRYIPISTNLTASLPTSQVRELALRDCYDVTTIEASDQAHHFEKLDRLYVGWTAQHSAHSPNVKLTSFEDIRSFEWW